MNNTPPVNIGVVWRTLLGMGHDFLARIPYLVVGLIVFLLFLLGARLTRRAIVFAGKRTALDVSLARLLGRLSAFTLQILGLFVAAVVIFPGFKPSDLVTGLGITSIAIGFAFKDVMQNFLAGVLILWRQPFRVGDQIKSGIYEGTVEDINVRSTRIHTFDGERAVIPNSDVYTGAILVKTAYDKRRGRFTVGIGYGDSVEESRAVIMDVLKKTDGVLDDPGPWVYLTELAGSSVNFTVYFWTASDQATVLRVGDKVATGIKLALDKSGIDMPYPHTVVILQDPPAAPEAPAAKTAPANRPAST